MIVQGALGIDGASRGQCVLIREGMSAAFGQTSTREYFTITEGGCLIACTVADVYLLPGSPETIGQFILKRGAQSMDVVSDVLRFTTISCSKLVGDELQKHNKHVIDAGR